MQFWVAKSLYPYNSNFLIVALASALASGVTLRTELNSSCVDLRPLLTATTWLEAHDLARLGDYCQRSPGRLPLPTSHQENSAMASMLTRLCNRGDTCAAWLPVGNRAGQDDTLFQAFDGTDFSIPINFTNWAPGEPKRGFTCPDNFGNLCSQCVLMLSNGSWYTRACVDNFGLIGLLISFPEGDCRTCSGRPASCSFSVG